MKTYQLVSDTNRHAFQDKINEALQQGWELAGTMTSVVIEERQHGSAMISVSVEYSQGMTCEVAK